MYVYLCKCTYVYVFLLSLGEDKIMEKILPNHTLRSHKVILFSLPNFY